MYKIILDYSAEKDLSSISKVNMRKIVKVIDKLAVNPKPLGVKKLKASDENLFRVRSGDYRIIYVIEEKIKIVNIRRIRHRKDVYRNL